MHSIVEIICFNRCIRLVRSYLVVKFALKYAAEQFALLTYFICGLFINLRTGSDYNTQYVVCYAALWYGVVCHGMVRYGEVEFYILYSKYGRVRLW